MRRVGCPIALTLLTACTTATPGGSPSPQATRFATTEPLPSAASTPSGVPASLSPQRVDAIRAELSGRGIDTADLSVVSAERVTFSDGSLGCPVPGVQYTQAQVDGMRVVVQVAGQTYDYRFGANDLPQLCEQRRPGAASSNR